MTKKDYIAIAKVIKDSRKPQTSLTDVNEVCDRIAHNLVPILQKDNPNFDRNRFLLACGVTVG